MKVPENAPEIATPVQTKSKPEYQHSKPLEPSNLIQRAAASPKSLSQNDVMQMQSIAGNKKTENFFSTPLQRKESSSIPNLSLPNLDKKLGNTPIQRKESSSNLPSEVGAKMESSFQTDFSDVSIHTNSNQAKSIGALAYTQGSDIHFAPGQFKPDTTSGQKLIGHELTHVVQQREGSVKPTTSVGGMPVNDSPSLEKQADVMGNRAAAGKVVSMKAARGISRSK